MKLRQIVPATLCAAALASATCGPHGPAEGVDEYYVNCDGAPAGQPFVSDESYTKFVEAESAGTVMPSACEAPVLTSPSPGSVLDSPPTFVFSPRQDPCPQATRAPEPAAKVAARKPKSRRFEFATVTRVLRGLVPIGTAYAHCPAVSGENYLLQLTAAGEVEPFYVALLSVTTFTPNADRWRAAVAGRNGKQVTVTIQRALFVGGLVMEGPYVQTQPFAFTLAP